jgi:hypothetical protein
MTPRGASFPRHFTPFRLVMLRVAPPGIRKGIEHSICVLGIRDENSWTDG